MIKEKILAKYRKLHNKIGTLKEAEDKEEFHTKHRAIWGACDKELALIGEGASRREAT